MAEHILEEGQERRKQEEEEFKASQEKEKAKIAQKHEQKEKAIRDDQERLKKETEKNWREKISDLTTGMEKKQNELQTLEGRLKQAKVSLEQARLTVVNTKRSVAVKLEEAAATAAESVTQADAERKRKRVERLSEERKSREAEEKRLVVQSEHVW